MLGKKKKEKARRVKFRGEEEDDYEDEEFEDEDVEEPEEKPKRKSFESKVGKVPLTESKSLTPEEVKGLALYHLERALLYMRYM